HRGKRMMGHCIARSVNQRGPGDYKFLDIAVIEARFLDISAKSGRIEDEGVDVFHPRLQEAVCVFHFLGKIVSSPSPGELSHDHSSPRGRVELIALQRPNAGPRTLFDLSHNSMALVGI